jgi:very-short-patch-repair endonuclease
MRPKRTTPKMMHRAGELRKDLSSAEAKLWSYLRKGQLRGFKFRRQHAIGNYIVDFCVPGQKLVIELDGSHHLDQEEYDAMRSAYLIDKGFRVLRFWNNQVMNDIAGVILAIEMALMEKQVTSGE